MFFKAKKDSVSNPVSNADTKDAKDSAAPPQPAQPLDQAPPINGVPTDAPNPTVESDVRRQAALSKGLQAALGQIVSVLMRSEQHANMSLNALKNHVLPGIALGQFSIAEAQAKSGITTPVGFVIWANVSEEIDRRLSNEAVLALNPSDWNSGSTPWIMHAVGDQRLVDAIIDKLLRQVWVGKKAKIRIKTAGSSIQVAVLEPKVASSQQSTPIS